jgi:predicted esterase
MSNPTAPPSSPFATGKKDQIHLQMQQGISSAGQAVWKDAGPIHLLHEKSRQSSPASVVPTLPLPNAAKEWLLSKHTVLTKKDRRNLYLFRHSSVGPNTNLLLLLHGAGDSHRPFDKLAQTMALPQTASLSLNSKICGIELPFDLGYSWFQDMDYSTGDDLPQMNEKRIASLHHTAEFLRQLIKRLHSAWIPERIFFLGYGAGATATMEVCRLWTTDQPLGGAICVGPGLGSLKQESSRARKTPVLLLSEHPQVLQQCKEAYDHECGKDSVEIYVQPKKGMISSPQEMGAVMKWLAPRLVLSTQLPYTS